MKTMMMSIVATVAITFAAGSAQAGGFGKSGSTGLVNVGNVSVLNGIAIANNSPILSGNVVSGILSGNKTSVGNGTLNNIAVGILGGNSYKAKRGH